MRGYQNTRGPKDHMLSGRSLSIVQRRFGTSLVAVAWHRCILLHTALQKCVYQWMPQCPHLTISRRSRNARKSASVICLGPACIRGKIAAIHRVIATKHPKRSCRTNSCDHAKVLAGCIYITSWLSASAYGGLQAGSRSACKRPSLGGPNHRGRADPPLEFVNG